MEGLVQARWGLLLAALAGAGLNFWMIGSQTPTPGAELLLPVVALLQAGGVYGFAKYRAARGQKAGWPVFVGYAAAVLWVIAFLSGLAAVAAGPGGLVYGLLITLPTIVLAPILQIAALIGFRGKQKPA
jgi:peptidoglycan/LPS O-acetylase OafA/YrhL